MAMERSLKDIQNTLWMPLWGRAKLTRLGNPVLQDPKSVEIVDRLIEMDFSVIDQAFNDLFNAAWIVRARMFDDTIRAFLSESPSGNVVNLGAGLDTTFFRVDNGLNHWYDLDLPDVIALRKKLIPEAPRQTCIASSMFERGWMEAFQAHGERVLFLAGGVLYYFHEEQVKELFLNLVEQFPGAEIVFDSMSSASIPFVNKGLQASGNESALVYWGLDDPETLKAWDKRLTVLESYPMFAHVTEREFWGPAVAAYMARSDAGNASAIAHLRLGG
jgi:O-methyltransferase involved in polyketide biosynthesis